MYVCMYVCVYVCMYIVRATAEAPDSKESRVGASKDPPLLGLTMVGACTSKPGEPLLPSLSF
jgi:hypothetical protein